MEVTYTRSKVIHDLAHRQWEQASRYSVVAADETSVAIVQFGKIEIKQRFTATLPIIPVVGRKARAWGATVGLAGVIHGWGSPPTDDEKTEVRVPRHGWN